MLINSFFKKIKIHFSNFYFACHINRQDQHSFLFTTRI